MKRVRQTRIRLFLPVVILLSFCSQPKKKIAEVPAVAEKVVKKNFHPTNGFIEVIDPSIDKIINKEAKIEVLAEGYEWTEGPVWVPEGEYLLFSDIPNNKVVKWKQGEGATSFLTPSGHAGIVDRSGEAGSNGLMLNAKGQLVLCQHTGRQIAIMNADLSNPAPTYTTVTGEYDGKKFNSPNDLYIHSNGDIYFTDPPYGLEKRDG